MNADDPIPNPQDLQLLVERFHRAKWIEGASMGSSEPFRMRFTPHGRWRMRQLFAAFQGATVENFQTPPIFAQRSPATLL